MSPPLVPQLCPPTFLSPTTPFYFPPSLFPFPLPLLSLAHSFFPHMTSPPFLIDLPAGSPSPLGKYHSDLPFPPGSPPPCRKGFSPFLNLELPLATGKGYSDHPVHTAGLSPNAGKRCNESSHPLESPCFSRDPFSCLTGSPGISSTIDTPPCPPQLIPSPPPRSHLSQPQPPSHSGRCYFESSSPLLERTYCREPCHSDSPPSSPYFEQFSITGSPPVCQRTPYCTWISPSRMRRPCLQGTNFDQNTNLCYYSGCPSAFGTSPAISSPLAERSPGRSPLTSPQLTHVPLETGLMISPPPTHRTRGTCLKISPPLARRPVETSPVASPTLSHRVLETGLMISLPSHWSSGRSYNDPLLSPASSPPTGNFYCGSSKPPDSCEPKPQLDLPLEKNCGSPLSSQAGMPGSPSSPREGSYHYSHLSSEAYVPTPGSPCCATRLRFGSTDSPCSPQFQAPRKACFESLLSWETGGNSYLILTPDTTISGPPCSQEPSLPHCPHSGLSSFPSPPGNQFISPPQPLPHRSYNEPPLPTPVSPQEKSPKSSELRQSHTPHRCHSLVSTPQHTPSGQPKPAKASTSPPPPSHLSGLSCMEPSITTPSNSSPKELPPGTALPTVVPRTLKTVSPSSLPFCLPCDPVSSNGYAQSSPHGPPCKTHIYSVVPSPTHPCPLSGSLNHSTGPPPIVPLCDTYSTPRGPPQPRCQPVVPPCSTHIYSFIPLRTSFDPQSLPIFPRVRAYPDTVPCGLHIYPVAPQGPCKEPLQIPYSCPLPSSKDSSCSTNPSCSSTVISECQSSDSQSRSSYQSQIQSQSKSPHHGTSQSRSKSHHLSRSPSQKRSPYPSRSRSGSSSPQQNTSQGQSESPHLSINEHQDESPQISRGQGKSKSLHHGRSRNRSKSTQRGKSQGQSKSPQHSRSQSKSPSRGKSHSQSKSTHHNKK
ncbi:sperm head and tail associated protein-like [Sapajus apella]|uniref:Sperm head and tail associated protein-like n=1 Tax=Sapajus apella TaxID=9515 RepID=A0A6J3FCE5_SAPAP|nr:sperm head and tail associated protein-like [Sapajus apella]